MCLPDSHVEIISQRHLPIARSEFMNCPPSFRFPPLREGNRERRAYLVPPVSRENLKEGVFDCCFFVNFGLAIGIRG